MRKTETPAEKIARLTALEAKYQFALSNPCNTGSTVRYLKACLSRTQGALAEVLYASLSTVEG